MIGKHNPETTYFIQNKYHWDLFCTSPDEFHLEKHSNGVVLMGTAGVFQKEYEIKRKMDQDYVNALMWGKPKDN